MYLSNYELQLAVAKLALPGLKSTAYAEDYETAEAYEERQTLIAVTAANVGRAAAAAYGKQLNFVSERTS